MRFLYDPKRKLFAIGYNVSTNRLDGSSYDLLASEARLGSFVAIARGDVPLEHWFSMSRPYGAIGRKRVLLSWTGTMFEYLMPLLFQHSYPHSLLDKAAREAVAIQIDLRPHAWGAVGNFRVRLCRSGPEQDLSVQGLWRAGPRSEARHGGTTGRRPLCHSAGIESGTRCGSAESEKTDRPRFAWRLRLLRSNGFQPSTAARSFRQSSKRGVIVEAYMAHHQGMAFLALTNFLHDNPFPRRFHSDPRVRAFEALLQERIPTLPPLHLISTRPNEPVHPGPTILSPRQAASLPRPIPPTPRNTAAQQWPLWPDDHQQRRRLQSVGRPGTYAAGDRIRPVILRGPSAISMRPIRITSGRPPIIRSAASLMAYSVDFALDRAVFRRTDNSISSETEVIVSPEDDVEIRRITLINHSAQIPPPRPYQLC